MINSCKRLLLNRVIVVDEIILFGLIKRVIHLDTLSKCKKHLLSHRHHMIIITIYLKRGKRI